MKINKIEVKNFKAIADKVIDFNGCSAIVTAGNNKGKTSILSGLIDRFHGEKPDLIVKQGEEKGFNVIELSDGARIEWKFTEKTESFAFITKEGIKQTTGVLSAIGERYFGIKFDIDKFLNSGAQAQTRELQRIVGLDFEEIETRYKTAYSDRTDAKKELTRIAAAALAFPVVIQKPDIETLQKELNEANTSNDKLLSKWDAENQKQQKIIIDFNQEQLTQQMKYENLQDAAGVLVNHGYASDSLNNFLKANEAQKEKEFKQLEKPALKDTEKLNNALNDAQNDLRSYDAYQRDLKLYNAWIAEGKAARIAVDDAEDNVKAIQKEKTDLIASAKIPAEFEITDDGILYEGLPLTTSQISSSSKYIAALKLGSMVLGKIRTMHFDASFLDKNSLSAIQVWAAENDLQLLIERVAMDGGEVRYEIV